MSNAGWPIAGFGTPMLNAAYNAERMLHHARAVMAALGLAETEIEREIARAVKGSYETTFTLRQCLDMVLDQVEARHG